MVQTFCIQQVQRSERFLLNFIFFSDGFQVFEIFFPLQNNFSEKLSVKDTSLKAV